MRYICAIKRLIHLIFGRFSFGLFSFVVVTRNAQVHKSFAHISFSANALSRGEDLTDQNEKSILPHKNFQGKLNRERSRERLELASLKDVPLEVRHKEASKPLFLTRYE